MQRGRSNKRNDLLKTGALRHQRTPPRLLHSRALGIVHHDFHRAKFPSLFYTSREAGEHETRFELNIQQLMKADAKFIRELQCNIQFVGWKSGRRMSISRTTDEEFTADCEVREYRCKNAVDRK